MSGQGARQHGGGRHHVGEGVRGGGRHGRRAELLPQYPVEMAHPQLHQDGSRQNGHRHQRKVHRLRAEDLPDGGLAQLQPHQEDHQAHQQPRQVLRPAVAEGVSIVGLLSRQLKSHQSHHRRARVGQVVEGIRRDGDGAGHNAGEELARRQQQIEHNPHRPGQDAVLLPHRRVRHIVAVLDEKPHQPIDHAVSPKDWFPFIIPRPPAIVKERFSPQTDGLPPSPCIHRYKVIE